MSTYSNLCGQKRFILTLATENYSRALNNLLASITHSNPKDKVLVYCVNWRPKLLHDFKQMYPTYVFHYYKTDKREPKDILALKVKIQMETAMRFPTCQWIWIDADAIILKSIDPLFNKLKYNGMIVTCRPNEKHEEMKYAVGVIGFNETTGRFLLRYHYHVLCCLHKDKRDWFQDQIGLTRATNEFKDLKIHCLNENEHSINDNKDTIIYSRRVENKQTIDEVLKEKRVKVPKIDFSGTTQKY